MTSVAPSVSVVVAARNVERVVGHCVRSLLGLDYPRDRLELVLVDNASSDGTRRVLESFRDEVVLVDEKRRGPAAARNGGIRVARGDVIAICDADAVVDPGWLRALVPALADPGVGIAGGRILAARPANAIQLFGETIHDAYSAALVWTPPYVITINWAARRTVLDEVGLFDERLRRCSDVDFSWRAVEAGYELAYCPEAVVYHHNERTLAGLFREGWVHGFHGVRIRRRYARLIAGRGPARAPELERRPSAFSRVFRTGKRLGRAMGALRWSVS
jgi:mycofactocin glycosyltransferase